MITPKQKFKYIHKEQSQLDDRKARIDSQHLKGKLTARERIDLLLDDSSFIEMDALVVHRCNDFGMGNKKIPGDGVITGYGTLNGRLVYVYAHDFKVFGGTIAEMFAKKIGKIMDLALKNKVPIIGLNDSGGARIQEGIISLEGCAEIFYRNVRCSGVVPQISAIVGPCAGAASYSPALTDFVFQVKNIGNVFITGPDVVKAAIGEETTIDELGGWEMHGKQSGLSHFIVENEVECYKNIQKLLSFIPQNNQEKPKRIKTDDERNRLSKELNSIIPEDHKKPYDMKRIIEIVLDRTSFFEVHSLWAKSIICGFGRLDGYSVGIVANQPNYIAGAIDSCAAIKASRFIRFCDCFNVPIITFVDVPGFFPGTQQESSGIIRNGAKLLYAFCEATVPRLTVVTRKAYGGAHIVMNSKNLFADINYAWPSAEFAVMGPEGAMSILYKKEMKNSVDPKSQKEIFVKEYRKKYASPYAAAEMGFVDEIIQPHETRQKLIFALESLQNKDIVNEKRKHGNIPL
ncbi:MAG: acyl-CoA carboxylase subunit beta [Calditrichia bacterium]